MTAIAGRRRRYLFLFFAALAIAASFYCDRSAGVWIAQNQNVAMIKFMRGVSQYGDWPEHLAVGLLLLLIAYFRGSKKWMRIFAAMILACALAGVTARIVKVGAGRARPKVQTESEWNGPNLRSRYNAFPSGHTAASAAFFAALALASWRIGAAFLIIPILIAFSRMYIAAHYLSDVVCASLLGILTAYFVMRWMLDEIQNPQSKI